MLELMIAIFIYAFWFSLIVGTMTLFLIRMYMVLNYRIELKKAMMVLFTPCSIGFYLNIKKENRLTVWYRSFVVLFFVTTMIGSLLILYIHLELNLI